MVGCAPLDSTIEEDEEVDVGVMAGLTIQWARESTVERERPEVRGGASAFPTSSHSAESSKGLVTIVLEINGEDREITGSKSSKGKTESCGR